MADFNEIYDLMNSDQSRIADWQRVDFKHPDGLMTLKCHYGCDVEEFTVKGKPADEEEFGKHEDENPEYAQLPLCCGNMLFTAWEPADDILKKYDLTMDEYWEVCYWLDKALSFGSCDQCG